MFKKMILVGLISMVPIIELRGAIPYAVLWDAQPLWLAILIAVIGNMIPVPFIYLFARKILVWGADKPVIGKFFSFCLDMGFKKSVLACMGGVLVAGTIMFCLSFFARGTFMALFG